MMGLKNLIASIPSPSILTLPGDKAVLLLWLFSMNDNPNVVLINRILAYCLRILNVYSNILFNEGARKLACVNLHEF